MRDIVCTRDAPGAIGPYSQAVKGGGFIFVSGQLALDPATQQMIKGDARQQTERALQNVVAILKASGSSLDKVVRCDVFLKNMDDFEAMNDVYRKIFGPHPPARTTVEVARLPMSGGRNGQDAAGHRGSSLGEAGFHRRSQRCRCSYTLHHVRSSQLSPGVPVVAAVDGRSRDTSTRSPAQ